MIQNSHVINEHLISKETSTDPSKDQYLSSPYNMYN